MLSKTARWYTPAEAPRMATADNAERLAVCGRQSPLPASSASFGKAHGPTC
jgi:hypothetical protein